MENIYDMATRGAKLYHATYDSLTEEQRRIVRYACDLFKIAATIYGIMYDPYENLNKESRILKASAVAYSFGEVYKYFCELTGINAKDKDAVAKKLQAISDYTEKRGWLYLPFYEKLENGKVRKGEMVYVTAAGMINDISNFIIEARQIRNTEKEEKK